MEIKPIVENLAIMLTEKCNHSCYHCFRPVTNYTERLNVENLSLLAERLCDSTIKNVRFTGGEPLLFKGLIQIVKVFSVKGFNVSIGTNATLLDASLLNMLKDAGLKEIWTTIHSQDPYLHNKLCCNKKALYKTESAISNCLRLGIKTCVNFPVSKYNRHDLLHTISYLQKIGVDRIKILRITPMGKAADTSFEHLNNDEWNEIIHEIANQDYSNFNIKVQGCSPLSDNEGNCNIFPIKHLNVSPQGKISPCCLMNNSPDYEIGDITELLSMDFNSAIKLFNYRISNNKAFLLSSLPCIKEDKGRNVCPLYSRHTTESDRRIIYD